jgi:hypothetical protein
MGAAARKRRGQADAVCRSDGNDAVVTGVLRLRYRAARISVGASAG